MENRYGVFNTRYLHFLSPQNNPQFHVMSCNPYFSEMHVLALLPFLLLLSWNIAAAEQTTKRIHVASTPVDERTYLFSDSSQVTTPAYLSVFPSLSLFVCFFSSHLTSFFSRILSNFQSFSLILTIISSVSR